MVITSFVLNPDVPLGPVFLIVAVVIIFYIWTQHREKMTLIRKGESIVNIDSLEQMKTSHLSKGIIAISLSLGILSGYFLQSESSLNPWVAYSTMLMLFFGAGALIFYVLIRNQ